MYVRLIVLYFELLFLTSVQLQDTRLSNTLGYFTRSRNESFGQLNSNRATTFNNQKLSGLSNFSRTTLDNTSNELFGKLTGRANSTPGGSRRPLSPMKIKPETVSNSGAGNDAEDIVIV